MSKRIKLPSHPDRRQMIASAAAASAAALLPTAALAQSPRLKLRILETTDIHVNVAAYDYFRDTADDTVGLAKTATLLKAARAEVKNSITFDNGDFIQGSPLGDYMAYKKGLKKGDTHPMVAAMNTLGYACGTLGNHEFNYGLDYLENGCAAANFPLVCANVFKADGKPLLKPWIVVEREFEDDAGARQKLKLGVIGFVPPQIAQWDKGNLEGKATAIDIVDAAKKYVPELRQQNVDLVVALCHSGIAGGERKGGEENAALYLSMVDGVDVILTGHQHLVFPGNRAFDNIPGVDNKKGSLNGKPAIQPGFWGSHLGIIDLDLEKRGNAWAIADFKVDPKPIYERTPDRKIVSKADADAGVMAAVKTDHEATLAYVRTPVSATAAPITSYFALVADDPSVQIVSNAQLWYAKQWIVNTPYAKLPILSAAAPFKAGGRGGPNYFTDIPPGPIAIKDLADIYIYPNTLQIVKVNGAQLRGWLERSAGMFNRIDPAKTEEQPLLNDAFPAFNFDVIDGITYAIDVSQPSMFDVEGKVVAPDAKRIVDLKFDGKPVADAQEFIVVTNNYRASGGGNFPGTKTTVVFEAPDMNRDVIMRYLIEEKTVNPTADGNWVFAALPATTNVTFLTGPKAKDFLPKTLKASLVGDGQDGFIKYKLVF
ncbi:bifunctional 2',3'-cyclic-nucleotide 2'-phosphodiesterase/3'-nucleotidase [Terrarubrum flagellatum]|uniref:bifunctional 2',3'-cyclic-nucleotide 2'-phosphodiesterase/3'-nucleotidase n=1 Tax=Terrirubrum flagellatum TaxID=2895980 RepID=UPI003144F596